MLSDYVLVYTWNGFVGALPPVKVQQKDKKHLLLVLGALLWKAGEKYIDLGSFF